MRLTLAAQADSCGNSYDEHDSHMALAGYWIVAAIF